MCFMILFLQNVGYQIWEISNSALATGWGLDLDTGPNKHYAVPRGFWWVFSNKYGMEKREVESYLHCLEEQTVLHDHSGDWWHCKNTKIREEEDALNQKISLSIMPIKKRVMWNWNAGRCRGAGPGFVAASGEAKSSAGSHGWGVWAHSAFAFGYMPGAGPLLLSPGVQQSSSPCCIPLSPGLCWPQPKMLLGLGECRKCRSSSLQHPLSMWQQRRFCTGQV